MLGAVRSGRDFLQSYLDARVKCPKPSNFFANLGSARRLALVRELNDRLARAMKHDDLHQPELVDFDVYAGDGHWHEASIHDDRISHRRWPVGHVYACNLRTRGLHHLTLNQGQREHDMSVIKRMGPEAMRMGASRGRKVLWVWDRAGIDFTLWQRWKQTKGIYFISRPKENMKLEGLALPQFDSTDPMNHGVLSDERVATSQQTMVRRVRYQDPDQPQRILEFITTLTTVSPGLIAWLYRKRWDIEKVFDEFKTKLQETKAWGRSATAKQMQALFLCLTHDLLECFERQLALTHHVHDEAGRRRQAQRLNRLKQRAAQSANLVSSLITGS